MPACNGLFYSNKIGQSLKQKVRLLVIRTRSRMRSAAIYSLLPAGLLRYPPKGPYGKSPARSGV
ncbi:hypothetical protein HMPREF3038_01081 [Akkermansia sp. KLE1797]|nr:hypothetical protein HMPREF3038_01081 [Akkermansia sp. KLE1797]KXU53442.1 hypothetical protein HMPREF3039_02444 [Akkermansia sp. KLE1798]KZA05019.1 hypothetical protein HMPREF1326_01237 [Akkermansia sp. KLE1605]